MTSGTTEPKPRLVPKVTCNPAGIPAGLRERRHWVVWRYEIIKSNITKVPYNARTGRRASSSSPATWSSFDDAVAAWKRGGYSGIGYVFAENDPFCGVDLDACLDANRELVPAAREVVNSLNSYSEFSPGGEGVKIIVEARKPDGCTRCKSRAIPGYKESEVYDRGQYFTLTGQRLPDMPATIEKRQEELASLCKRLWPPRKRKVRKTPSRAGGFAGTDDELIEKASRAENGQKFTWLWGGDTSMHGDDDSSADLALCLILAFWTGRDAAQMDALFRRSGLMRAKWDERHCGDGRTYGQMTIQKAINDCAEVHTPAREKKRQPLAGPSGIELVPLRITATPSRRSARFAVRVAGRDTNTELTATDTSTGVKRAASDLVDIVAAAGGSTDEKALKEWLRTILTSSKLAALEKTLSPRDDADKPASLGNRGDMVTLATSYMMDVLALSFVGHDGTVWSERSARMIGRQEFISQASPELLDRLKLASDFAAPTTADPTKAIRNLGYVLRAAWSAVQDRLSDELRAENIGPASNAAAVRRQQVIDLWLAPETWMKFEAAGDSPAHVERMSLASRARTLVNTAFAEKPAWRRMLKGVEGFYRIERSTNSEPVVWLGMRFDLCRGQIKGHRIQGPRNQQELTVLLRRYGLADEGSVTDRLREDGRQSRLCVLARGLCDYLIECIDDDDVEGCVTDRGGEPVTTPLAPGTVDMETGELLEESK